VCTGRTKFFFPREFCHLLQNLFTNLTEMVSWGFDPRYHQPRTEDPWLLQVWLEFITEAGSRLQVSACHLLLFGKRRVTCGRGIRKAHWDQRSVHLAEGLWTPPDVGDDLGPHVLRLGQNDGLGFCLFFCSFSLVALL